MIGESTRKNRTAAKKAAMMMMMMHECPSKGGF
jgi:hypothetical protein